MKDTTTKGLTFTRPLPQGSAPPAKGAFWTDEYGWLVKVDGPVYQFTDDEKINARKSLLLRNKWLAEVGGNDE